MSQQQLPPQPVFFKTSKTDNGSATFWTVCPYCYYLYEYEKKYEECSLLCQTCKKGFHGMAVAPPPLVTGKEEKFYSGYGFFPLGFNGKSFFGDKNKVGDGDTGKSHGYVEISDDSDGEEPMHVRNKAGEVKVGSFNNGGGLGMMKRVKSVQRNIKKMMGRGIKVNKVEKVNSEKLGDEVPDSDGEIRIGSGSNQSDCAMDDLMFFEGDDDIFVDLRDIL